MQRLFVGETFGLPHKARRRQMKIQEIKELGDWFEKSNLTNLDWTEGEASLRFEKSAAGMGKHQATLPAAEPSSCTKVVEEIKDEEGKSVSKETIVCSGLLVKSPVVGTFYASPSPEEESFVKKGETVQKGQVICIVEAMKLLNEIVAPASGKVKKYLSKTEIL